MRDLIPRFLIGFYGNNLQYIIRVIKEIRRAQLLKISNEDYITLKQFKFVIEKYPSFIAQIEKEVKEHQEAEKEKYTDFVNKNKLLFRLFPANDFLTNYPIPKYKNAPPPPPKIKFKKEQY
jgi:Mg2+ and Co2+ transporter CorA